MYVHTHACIHTHTHTTASYPGKNDVLTQGSLLARIPAIILFTAEDSIKHTTNYLIVSSSSHYIAISVLKLTVLRESLLSACTFSPLSDFSKVQTRLSQVGMTSYPSCLQISLADSTK